MSTACECDDGEREEEETTTGPDDIEVSEWEGSWAGVRHLLLDNWEFFYRKKKRRGRRGVSFDCQVGK